MRVFTASGDPEALPVKTRKLRRGQRENALLLLQRGAAVWLQQRPATGVWAGLWTPPLFETTLQLEETLAAWPGRGDWLPSVRHALTHFDWTLHPMRWHWPARGRAEPPLSEGRWFPLPEALRAGLPAPVRRLIEPLA